MRYLPYVYLTLATFIWGSSFVGLKLAMEHMDWRWVIWGRMAVASVCFLFVIKRIATFTYQAGDWKLLLLMVFSEPCLYFIFEGLALKYTSASQAGVVTAVGPLLISLGAVVFLKERLSPRVWLGFLIAFLGSVWLSVAADVNHSAPNPLLGNALEFMAIVCAVGYVLSLKKLSERYSTWFLTALQCFAGCFFFTFFLPFAEFPVGVPAQAWWAVFYLGGVVSIGAYGFYNLGVSKTKASLSSVFLNMISVSSVLIAYVVLGERLNGQQWLACGLVMAGVVLSQWSFGQKKEEA